MNTFEINHCEVCGNQNLPSVLNLGHHPLCDDLIPISESRISKEYPIEILFCDICKTAHQRFQVPKHELFPHSYHYRSRFTADVLNGMQELVNSCEKKLGHLHHKKVLDVGCNDGSLLNFFRSKGAKTFGIEPTSAYLDAKKAGHEVEQAFFSSEVAERFLKRYGKPDIITFTNVFAHIENLPEIINALKILMSSNLLIVIENHYLGSVLKGNQFDTFYHEHPRSYSLTSFQYIAKSIGTELTSIEFPARYGGNIRVMLGGQKNKEAQDLLNKIKMEEQQFIQQFEALNINIKQWQKNKGSFIQSLKESNTQCLGKAFPGRAAILIKLLGIDESVISAVYEKPGSMKIDHYIPGTRIPIRSDEELFASKSKDTIINFAWHISGEIKKYLNENGIRSNIIDILEHQDFTQLEESSCQNN